MKKAIVILVSLLSGIYSYSQGFQIPEVISNTKIGNNLSGFPADSIANGDRFGYAVARIGDINGDEIEDIAIGAPYSDVGGSSSNKGCIWICIMEDDYTVNSYKRIASGKHGMSVLGDNDFFGSSIAGIGDVDGDNIPDVAVGAPGNNDDGDQSGAVWILFMNSNGTIKSSPKEISDTEITGYNLAADDSLGISVAGVGDLDGNGVPDIAVGANGSDVVASNAGCAFILFLKNDGDRTGEYQIYTGLSLASGDQFGYALSVYPDVDNDGLNELLVGSPYDDNTAGTNFGSVLLLRLNTSGSVKSPHYIFNSPIDGTKEYFIVPAANVQLGRSVSYADFNSDGNYDIIVGAPGDQAFYAILLDENLEDISWRKFGADYAWDFTFPGGHLQFAFSLTSISDLDEDGSLELIIGAPRADDGGTDRGVVYVLKLDSLDVFEDIGQISNVHKISDLSGKFTGTLDNNDAWGTSVCSLGDLNADGNEDFAVTTTFDDDGSTNRGAVYILFLNNVGVVSSFQKISDTQGSFGGTLTNDCRFGTGVTNLGDLDGDDVIDIAVGTIQDDDGGTDRGAVWILFLNTDGTVKSEVKISDTQGGFGGTLTNGCLFGNPANIGDINNDGVVDLAVGALRDDDGGTDRGAVWIIFLDSTGTAINESKISDTDGGFTATLANSDNFGSSVYGIGDFNKDGVEDLLVSARAQDGTGAAYIVYLNTSGDAIGYVKINNAASNFPGTLVSGELFGVDLKSCGDLDDNGVTDFIIGSQNFNDIGTQRGSAWICYMDEDGTVLYSKRIGVTSDDFYGLLDNADIFGNCVGVFSSDLNSDGATDFMVGARNDDDGGDGRGSLYVLSHFPPGRLKTTKYAKLDYTLDKEYHQTFQKRLYFIYDEEYNVGVTNYLNYKVYDETRTVVAESDASGNVLSGSSTATVSFGRNYMRLNLPTSLTSGIYVLEVVGPKNDKYYLRFKI